MGKLFCILGKSSSGKDSIFRALKADPQLSLRCVVPYTTRPPREGETEGIEYHFIAEQKLREFESTGKVIEVRRYDTIRGAWYYATVDDGRLNLANRDYLMITTLEACQNLRNYFGPSNVEPLYIEVEDGLRLERALKRERLRECPEYEEMCRRFLADCRDYSEEKLRECEISKRYINNDLAFCLYNIKKDIQKLRQA